MGEGGGLALTPFPALPALRPMPDVRCASLYGLAPILFGWRVFPVRLGPAPSAAPGEVLRSTYAQRQKAPCGRRCRANASRFPRSKSTGRGTEWALNSLRAFQALACFLPFRVGHGNRFGAYLDDGPNGILATLARRQITTSLYLPGGRRRIARPRRRTRLHLASTFLLSDV